MKIFQWIFGELVSKKVMPAQNRQDTHKHLRAITEQNGIRIQQRMIDSSGGARINLAEFNSIKQTKQAKKLIVFTVGNSDGYEREFELFLKMARSFPKVQIAAFNFRNVYASTGRATCEQDWIDDAKSVAYYYRSQGFKNKNILFCGHSLGGAISTMMAAQLYEEDCRQAKQFGAKQPKSIKLINNRSFANLVDVIMIGLLGTGICSMMNAALYGILMASAAALLGAGALVGAEVGLGVGLMTGFYSWVHPRFCYDILRPWFKLATHLVFGVMNAFDSYQKLPENSKDYLVAKNESVTTKYASLHHYLRKDREKNQRALAKEISQLEQIELQQDQDLNPRQQERLCKLKAELLNIKDSKLRHRYIDDGFMSHNDQLCQLTTYHQMRKGAMKEQINGQSVLINKVKRIHNLS